MARIARVVVPDFPHHVVQRDACRMDVFFSADDRQEYLDLVISISFETRARFPSMVSDEQSRPPDLRAGRPLGAADFVDQLEQVIGTSLRRKKVAWQKGKKRK